MANIPSYAERLDIQRQVQEICKTKGQYAKKKFSSFENFVRFFSNKYRSMKDSIYSCIKNLKNLINEYIKWAQQGLECGTEYALTWFKGYLNLVLKAAKHGIKMAESFYKIIAKKIKIKEGIIFLGMAALSIVLGSILLGIVCSIIQLAIAWWMKVTYKADFALSTDRTMLDKTKSFYNKHLANDKGELPDDLLPPDPEVPNITMSFTESTNLNEDAVAIGAGILFLLFLKASVASVYNEEMSQKTRVLKSAIPGPATLAFTGLILFFAAHSASFLPGMV